VLAVMKVMVDVGRTRRCIGSGRLSIGTFGGRGGGSLGIGLSILVCILSKKSAGIMSMLGSLRGRGYSVESCLSEPLIPSRPPFALWDTGFEVLLSASSHFVFCRSGREEEDFTTAESDLDRRCLSPTSVRAFLALAPDTIDEPLLDLTQPPRTNSGVGGGRFVCFEVTDELECRSLRLCFSPDFWLSLSSRASLDGETRLRRELSCARAAMVSTAALSDRLYNARWDVERVLESPDKAWLIRLISPVLRTRRV
jgi:hypothetical protein